MRKMWPLFTWRNNPDLNLNDHLQTLSDKMNQLGSKADDIQSLVQTKLESHPSKKRKSEVTLWLTQVEEIKQKVKLVVDNIDHGISRELLDDNAIKGMIKRIDELLKQGEFSQGLVLDDRKLKGITLVTTKLEGSTPVMVKNNVLSALTRGESRVGVFGMGGVGKTAVAMHVNNDILSGRWDCFNHVFYVPVERGSTVYQLQRDISKALALTLYSGKETIRAAELSDSLKKREKSLLILDDIWEDNPMEKVGVAVEGDGCKLLITTRKIDVCHKMRCHPIEMKPLLENEARNLFVNTLGNYESLDDATKLVARSIAEKCAGLPLAIITMATSMRGNFDECVWRDMLKKLQNPSSNHEDMEKKVLTLLELSYENLSKELQKCFLYCTLYHDTYRMSITDFIAVALLRNEDTRNQNRDEGHSMLKALADASLVEFTTDFYPRNIVKMHDLIRDMALKIIGSKGIVKPFKRMVEMPRKEEWTEDLVLVSLVGNLIEGSIHDDLFPVCPNLSVLILRMNYVDHIPYSFFVHMKGLTYLDLSFNFITELPYSIMNLCNLNALFLEHCKILKFIPSVARLTKLRDLNLCGTAIEKLPLGFKDLRNLKYLDITETPIQRIYGGLLYDLCKLESFLSNYMASIAPEALMHLNQLLSFQGRIDDLEAFKHCVGSNWFDRFESYSIVVGKPYPPGLHDGSRVRHILIHEPHLIPGFQNFPVEVWLEVPHSVQFLELKDCRFVAKCLLEALSSLCDAIELELCRLKSCSGIEYIISDAGFERGGYQVSTPIQRLQLIELVDLVGLYEGEAVHPHIFFGGLRVLKIDHCPSVKKIWLQIDDLPNMESIEVADCEKMEEVFATTVGAAIKLPCLKSIELFQLSELRSISWNSVFFPCLETVRVKHCPKLEKLWSVEDQPPSLQHVSVEDCDKLKGNSMN